MTMKRLRLLECGGSPAEIGRQYGEAARENIRKGLDMLMAWLEHAPYPCRVDRASVCAAAGKYLPNVERFFPEAVERIRGMAEGSGLPFEECFAVSCYTELVGVYPYLAPMCTSFAVAGPATKTGQTIIGQNVDWHQETPLDLMHVIHPDGSEHLALTFFCASSIFLTSHGLANSANLTLAPMGPVTDHTPFSCFLPEAMRQPTAGKALDILKKYSRGVEYFHVADADGRMAGVESVYDGCTVLEPQEGVLVHANHYETEAYTKDDVARMHISDSFKRADRLRELIREHYGELTPELMMKLMADHEGYPYSICRHLDPNVPYALSAISAASVVMVPEERVMYVAAGPPCENGFAEYSVGR